MENKKQTLLRTNNATYKTVDGVTYFKLKSEFDGDYTKNCGLLGEEIDENFYFLRGNDIETIYVDNDRNLVIERVDKDYEPIKVKIGEELGKDTFKFDKESGTIFITYADGTTAKMEGFLVAGKDIRMATDSSISGDGTIFNPLRISDVHVTGTYGPADQYFDLTINRELPTPKGKGYRIVTKEKVDKFGCLYSLDEIKLIQSKLEEEQSQWRVPSKQDWDELLNAMEVNPEYRNHESKSNKWLGQVAGSALKSTNLWKEFNPLKKSDILTDGQDVVGLSVLPLGIGPDRNEVLDEEDFDLEGFTKLSGMWTSTEDGTGNNYVKLFAYNSAQVDQDTYGKGAKLSLRLVKDYNYDNYNEIESILGLPYSTKLVYGICDDMPYVKIWTDMNIYLYGKNFGVRSEEWNVVTDSDRGVKIIYFINEWDGTEWHKKALKEAESIVIKEYKDKPYHEWRIINEELVDTVEDIMNAFDEALTEINERIDNEIEDRKNSDNKLLEAIQKETEVRLEVDNQLQAAISGETAMREKVDKELHSAIKSEATLRKNVDDQLLEAIRNEGKIRQEQDTILHNAIIDESNIRIEQDNQLRNAIVNEGNIRKEQDDLLRKAIVDEGLIRDEQDKKILEVIQKEAELRESVDNQLRDAIKSEADIRKSVDDQLLNAIRNEGVIRKKNDITPGTYVLDGDSEKEMTLPTNGEDIADVKIKVSSDFFNFGKIINE